LVQTSDCNLAESLGRAVQRFARVIDAYVAPLPYPAPPLCHRASQYLHRGVLDRLDSRVDKKDEYDTWASC
jgi:hypothetical protein